MKISAMPQSLAPGLSNHGKEYFRLGLRAMQGQCGRHVRGWHIASFRGGAEFCRYTGIADIGQARTNRARFVSTYAAECQTTKHAPTSSTDRTILFEQSKIAENLAAFVQNRLFFVGFDRCAVSLIAA
jgi:hypothetical protein